MTRRSIAVDRIAHSPSGSTVVREPGSRSPFPASPAAAHSTSRDRTPALCVGHCQKDFFVSSRSRYERARIERDQLESGDGNSPPALLSAALQHPAPGLGLHAPVSGTFANQQLATPMRGLANVPEKAMRPFAFQAVGLVRAFRHRLDDFLVQSCVCTGQADRDICSQSTRISSGAAIGCSCVAGTHRATSQRPWTALVRREDASAPPLGALGARGRASQPDQASWRGSACTAASMVGSESRVRARLRPPCAAHVSRSEPSTHARV